MNPLRYFFTLTCLIVVCLSAFGQPSGMDEEGMNPITTELAQIWTESCDTIYFPARMLAVQLIQEYTQIIQDLSDPRISSIQGTGAIKLVQESVANYFVGDQSIIEYWNVGEKAPNQRTVKQYLRALFNITKSSERKRWYEYVSLCIPNQGIRLLDKQILSNTENTFKYTVEFDQYYYGEGASRPTYKDVSTKRMDIVIPIQYCQYGSPKIQEINVIQAPEILQEFPTNLECK